MTIQGPKGGYCCGTSWLIDAQFPIVDIETGNEVGRIIRGSADPFESVDTFTMNFPRTLKVGVKVGLLGSAFAIVRLKSMRGQWSTSLLYNVFINVFLEFHVFRSPLLQSRYY